MDYVKTRPDNTHNNTTVIDEETLWNFITNIPMTHVGFIVLVAGFLTSVKNLVSCLLCLSLRN